MVQPEERSLSSCAEASESDFRLSTPTSLGSPSSTPSQLSLVNDQCNITDIQNTDGAVQNGDSINMFESGNNDNNGNLLDCSQLDPTTVDRDQLPPLSEPVPDNWVTIEEDFIFFTATLISHLSSDTVVVPSAKMNDGLMYLSIIRAGVSRMDILQMMSSSSEVKEHGDGHDAVERIKVSAFRLTPLTNEGIMTVDGERVPYGPIQGHVMPSAARLMCRPN